MIEEVKGSSEASGWIAFGDLRTGWKEPRGANEARALGATRFVSSSELSAPVSRPFLGKIIVILVYRKESFIIYSHSMR